MRKVHTRVKRHQGIRSHLGGAKVMRQRKQKQLRTLLHNEEAEKTI